jgi:pyruvate dehydrogenase E1 component alpha subunit
MDKSPYRSSEEEAAGRARDPVKHARAALVERGTVDSAVLDALDAEIGLEMDATLDFAAAAAPPPLSSMFRDVYAAGQPEPEPLRTRLERVLARA